MRVRLIISFALLCLCARVAVADPQPAPAPIPEDDLAAAEKTLAALTADQQAALNHLRYLLAPEYETELMAGRRFRPCMLGDFEKPPAGAMTQLEAVRLWAVLRSGMPPTPAMRRQVLRFMELPQPTRKDSLAPYGLAMAVCAAIHVRPEFEQADAVHAKATGLIEASIDVRTIIEEGSPLIVGREIDPRWFANHLWRAIACRAALAMGIEFNENVWEKDLRNLNGEFKRKRGWTSSTSEAPRVDHDYCTNLMAVAALSLAATAPEGSIEDGVVRTIDKRFNNVPEVLARLEKDYPFERMDGTCLGLAAMFAPTLAPANKLPADWHRSLRAAACAYEVAGAVKTRRMVASNLELGPSRNDRLVVDTALAVLGLSGGLLQGKGPLAALDMAAIARGMHALSVLHAHNLPAENGGFDEAAVNEAIQLGCENLEGIQLVDGSFPGVNAAYSGNTALCLLAMLHGGWDRDSTLIRKGLAWVLAYDPAKVKRGDEVAGVGYGNTYSDAIVLMLLQKYYEREQAAAGVFWPEDKADYERARKQVWAAIDSKHRALIERMLRNIDAAHVGGEQGGFGYYPGGVAAPGLAGASPTYSDNSCSQYAVLGYKAASLLGAKIKTEKLKHEAERLIKQYYAVEGFDEVEFTRPEDNRKSSSKEWKSKIRPGGWGYVSGSRSMPSLQMTAAGVSSLVVCQDELKIRGELELELERSLELTIHGAQTWMASAYYGKGDDEGLDVLVKAGGSDGWSVFYNLYSVERACVLAGLKQLGKDVNWYEIGARVLVEQQNAAGDWGPEKQSSPCTVNNCLAILFLKQASMPVITDPRRRLPKPAEPAPEPVPPPRDPVTGK